jgi:hypothetical protein
MFKSQLKTVLLLGSLSALLMGVGALVAPGMLALFAMLAVAMNIGAYFFSDDQVAVSSLPTTTCLAGSDAGNHVHPSAKGNLTCPCKP